MSEATDNKQTETPEPVAGPVIHVAPSPHSFSTSLTTKRMMIDVLIATAPLVIWAIVQFGMGAVGQLIVCIGGCIIAEAVFTAMRGRCPHKAITDFSAIVTGVILALSLPCTAPWYVGFIGAGAAVGIGKVVFGGLGQNIFNPAMVGRAFVMICFAGAMAAPAYKVNLAVVPAPLEATETALVASAAETRPAGDDIVKVPETKPVDVVSQATPMSTEVNYGELPVSVSSMFLGNVNGSIGEVSTLACLLGGLYLCWRRTAAWEIPLGVLLASACTVVLVHLWGGGAGLSLTDFLGYHMCGGALMFGAFYIATDPVSSPITPKGRWVFGIGLGLFIMLFRTMSAYPEGVMFAVLMMNAVAPLINRCTIPTPVGGPVPERK